MISSSVQQQINHPVKGRAEDLRARAHAFCQALVSPPSVEELLSEFFVPDASTSSTTSSTSPAGPVIQEHGPSWATSRLPFLGREFGPGVKPCAEYFAVLGDTLKMHLDGDSFPPEAGFVVDAAQNSVAVVGRGRFESVATGRSWDEKFSYVLGAWDDEGKIGRWDIWADPLSAWAAVGKEDVEGWKAGEHKS